ncbi:Response regulator receiver domain-containing protein [Maribacter sedimenticola]|uniref:Response regulator receiver domain-containing protein n=1 Tax=Maribacter sedimenticola TaxID=228956 RepID=A0ABY1SKR8_9FLAO|nr:response regulator [Maribacter sedimenticola]SNR71134.1 Response regulator receiver domain-containing protein [Maribacter sedimenticola]
MIKILIIEDDEITNFISKSTLEKFGFKNINVALNGQEGLDFLRSNMCPDIILLDVNMPVLDGWDFLEAKERENLCSNVPIIITTSSGRPEDRLMAATYDNVMDYMEKPIDFNALNSILKEIHANKANRTKKASL